MNTIAELSSTDRRDLFTETAARQGIGSAIVIEKDYWVCWTLSRLFSSTQHRWPDMVFKGGTSLSKAYNAIRRFSEDIDLSLGRAAFDFMDDAAFMALGANKRDAAINELLARGAALVCGPLADALETDFTTGLSDVQGSWALRRPDGADRNRAQTLTFEYPRSLEATTYGPDAYIRPAVLLEFGVRADKWPAELRPVVPYAGGTGHPLQGRDRGAGDSELALACDRPIGIGTKRVRDPGRTDARRSCGCPHRIS